MSTRIYLPYGSAPTLSPALTSAWERTSSYRYANGVTKQGTVFGEVSNYEYNVAAQYDAIVAQFVSGPLQAQTISGGDYSGHFECQYCQIMAGVYSEELFERALDISSFNVENMVAAAEAASDDWVPPIEGLYKQQSLTDDWALCNYWDSEHNFHYVRPHTQAELREAGLWPE